MPCASPDLKQAGACGRRPGQVARGGGCGGQGNSDLEISHKGGKFTILPYFVRFCPATYSYGWKLGISMFFARFWPEEDSWPCYMYFSHVFSTVGIFTRNFHPEFSPWDASEISPRILHPGNFHAEFSPWEFSPRIFTLRIFTQNFHPVFFTLGLFTLRCLFFTLGLLTLIRLCFCVCFFVFVFFVFLSLCFCVCVIVFPCLCLCYFACFCVCLFVFLCVGVFTLNFHPGNFHPEFSQGNSDLEISHKGGKFTILPYFVRFCPATYSYMAGS